jgi:hypothetical protein
VVPPTDAAVREDERRASETDNDGSQPGWGDDRPGFA